MKTIAIANQKGEIGNTTATLNIGAELTQIVKEDLFVGIPLQLDNHTATGQRTI